MLFQAMWFSVNRRTLIDKPMQAATDHSARALKGQMKDNIPDDWLGTVIRLAK